MKRAIPTRAECSDEFLQRIAAIIGSSSAASAALAERDRRRTAGEAAAIYLDTDSATIWVGPPLGRSEAEAIEAGGA